MFGFILGTLCLLALIATLRGRRWHMQHRLAHAGWLSWRGYGLHPGHYVRTGRFDDPACREFGHGRSRYGRQGALRALFEYLDTTPGQEKVIAQALSGMLERMHDARGELKSARKALAAVIGGDVIDASALDQALSLHKTLAERFTQELTQALLSVHEALDGEQRKELAELIANRPLGFRGLRYF